ncbi:MAG: alpha/beta hydrolase [Actinomycetota bacterium]
MPIALLREVTAAREYAGLARRAPELAALPGGDGHPVLVAPGLLAGDGSTLLLRRFLAAKGYAVESWGLGRNLGSPDVFDAYVERVARRSAALGVPVSLVGWSLGGIASRFAAAGEPDAVRQVITLGSPFRRDPRTLSIWPIYRTVSGARWSDFTDEKLSAVADTPPVPTTSVVSTQDAVVAVDDGFQPEGDASETVVIQGSHLGLGHNPEAYRIVADRLAQPAGEWTPYEACAA